MEQNEDELTVTGRFCPMGMRCSINEMNDQPPLVKNTTDSPTPQGLKMPPGVALSEDLRGVLVHMHSLCFLNPKTISELTGIPLRTIQRMLPFGRPLVHSSQNRMGKKGRPRALDFGDTQASQTQTHLFQQLTQIHVKVPLGLR